MVIPPTITAPVPAVPVATVPILDVISSSTGVMLPETQRAIDTLTALHIDVHALVKARPGLFGGPSTVYYIGIDGKRHAFPDERVYFSWYQDFSAVHEISPEQLALIPLGANVTYRPGSRMVKFLTDPKVYAVDTGGTLRWIRSEALAKELYGPFWAHTVSDVSDAFYSDYKFGSDIIFPTDFRPKLTEWLTQDTDKDGLSNGQEIALKTDPNNADTDGDGLPDGAEVYSYQTDPLKADTDGDGFDDGAEVRNGYDPLGPGKPDRKDRDSDGDGLSDYDETHVFRTNPFRADTDGDGLDDREEIFKYRTDPRNPDTDGDGYTDGVEVKSGNDPLKPPILLRIQRRVKSAAVQTVTVVRQAAQSVTSWVTR